MASALDRYVSGPDKIPRPQTDREAALFDEIMREFGQLQLQRNTFAAHWEEVAELILPTSRNTFFFGNFNWQGTKKTDRQIDATGMLALSRFAAICDSLNTPRNQIWHQLQANDDYVMKDRDTRIWFEAVTKIMFRERYAPHSNFASQNQNNYQSIGAFGNAAMFIDEFDGSNYAGTTGVRYKAIPLGELFWRENHQGVIDGFDRWFRFTARQAWQKWGAMGRFPEALRPALEQNSETLYDFIHRVCPNNEYDASRLDARGKPFASHYISLQGKCLLSEGGYRTFPIAPSRYEQTPGETYGRGPAMMVLPALKTLNAQKKTFLKQGHRAADPVLLVADDGVIDMNLRPGAINKGGISADGKPLVGVLPSGNIQINEKMMLEERSLINDAFLVTLFQILTDSPQMTATEVMERVNEKGILLAPTIGRQQSEYLGPMIDRELDILAAQRKLPPMPPRLREAGGSYETVYTSPLARAARAQEATGFIRTLQVVTEVVNVTQDPSPLDQFDFDTAVPAIADINGVPVSWMASDGQIAAKRKGRAQAQQQQAQIQALPAQAAMIKAQAVVSKNGTQTAAPQGQPPGAPQ